MTSLLLVPFVAALLSLVLAIARVSRRHLSLGAWCFFAGMVALAVDSVFTGLALAAIPPEEVSYWVTRAFIVKSLLPTIWLCFSLAYSRGNYLEFFKRWGWPLGLTGILPFALAVTFHNQLFQVGPPGEPGDLWRLQVGSAGRALNPVLLLGYVLTLMNLEQTFRAAVGTRRWRIKFVVLGVALIVGARLYVRSQAILFSSPDIALWSVESGSLVIGCVFLALAYFRAGLAEIDVYPSAALLRSSLTVMVVGGYLFLVGVLAQVVTRVGGAEIFQFQAVVVLIGIAGLAVLMLSDRTRQMTQAFIGRHFRKAQHDSVQIWASFSEGLAAVRDEAGVCAVSTKLISETLEVLSVSTWLFNEENGSLAIRASTTEGATRDGVTGAVASGDVAAGLGERSAPFDLESVKEPWAEEFRALNQSTFKNEASRYCVPLHAAEQSLGVIVLADRVNGVGYSVEERELLKCIGHQITSVLMNLRLGREVTRAKELEAFRTMSTFFVHDLKNAAASLYLMLNNLPAHFDDRAFREDALRGLGNSARRIDEIISRLSALRRQSESVRVEADLNQLVKDAIGRAGVVPNVEMTADLQPLPAVFVDPEQIQSVVTNLMLNARESLGRGGVIRVRTEKRDGKAVLSVTDNGCGMSSRFIAESLFRPFQSTKTKGLGIGLFQSRSIVQAHGGAMQVASEEGKGTTFLVSLPIRNGQ